MQNFIKQFFQQHQISACFVASLISLALSVSLLVVSVCVGLRGAIMYLFDQRNNKINSTSEGNYKDLCIDLQKKLLIETKKNFKSKAKGKTK